MPDEPPDDGENALTRVVDVAKDAMVIAPAAGLGGVAGGVGAGGAGAAIGFALGGPPGAAVGYLVGLVGGTLAGAAAAGVGANKVKKLLEETDGD